MLSADCERCTSAAPREAAGIGYRHHHRQHIEVKGFHRDTPLRVMRTLPGRPRPEATGRDGEARWRAWESTLPSENLKSINITRLPEGMRLRILAPFPTFRSRTRVTPHTYHQFKQLGMRTDVIARRSPRRSSSSCPAPCSTMPRRPVTCRATASTAGHLGLPEARELGAALLEAAGAGGRRRQLQRN